MAEFGLRKIGYIPGQIRYSQWFQKVDSLYLVEGIKADSLGITRVDTSIVESLYRIQNTDVDSFELLTNEPVWFNCSHEITNVLRDHTEMREGLIDGELAVKYRSLVSQGCKNSLDSAIIEYALHPINKCGFYSIPFYPVTSGRPRVLLVGDSFTWGHSSTNKTNSFANILLARGFTVYNSGISGADITQYEAVLKAHLETLKPDLVIVNLFLGNDLPNHCRETRPFVPVHFPTNAGNILSFQDGTYTNSAHEAYQNVVEEMYVPCDSSLSSFVKRSVIGSYAWAVLHRTRNQGDRRCSIASLRNMERLCDGQGVRFVISVIPRLNRLGFVKDASEVSDILSGLKYHEPSISKEMFDPDDGHFNDLGHRAYADHLVNLMDSKRP